jgi:hypothetical protein
LVYEVLSVRDKDFLFGLVFPRVIVQRKRCLAPVAARKLSDTRPRAKKRLFGSEYDTLSMGRRKAD